MVEPKWIAAAEYMPTMFVKKSTEEDEPDYLESDYVLVWDGRKVDIAQSVSDASGVYWLDRCADVVKATFWMPLPTPPEQLGGR